MNFGRISFCSQQAKLFEERMSSVFGGVEGAPSSDQINLTFQKMAEAAALAVQNVDEGATLHAEPQLADSLTEALKALKEGSGLLQEPIPPEGLSGMFSGLQLDEVSSYWRWPPDQCRWNTENLFWLQESGDNPFLPVMQGMMQSLLSAEVLLPSLKELLEKYPTWLVENSDKISAADKERYTKQQELFKVICAELEKEKPTDSADVKNERFKIVLKNMQKVRMDNI